MELCASLNPPERGWGDVGKVFSLPTITPKDPVTVFLLRLGVHAPLSTQMAFASDAAFSINLQSFITHIAYCKPSTPTSTHSLLGLPVLPVGAARHRGVVFRHDSFLINPPIWLQVVAVFKWKHAFPAPSLNHHFLSPLSLSLCFSFIPVLARPLMWLVVSVSSCLSGLFISKDQTDD